MKLKKKKENEVEIEESTEEVTVKNDGSLRDIMDRKKTFTMIYSGVENKDYFKIIYDLGIRDFLISFHYIQNRHLNMEKEYGGLGVKFLIDSGAHTYQNDPKYASETVEFWENHLKKYLAWVKKNKDYIFAIANFDYENLVGAEVVKRWNEQYFEPFMLETGIPVCFVWHQDSYDDWERYCKRYPYVGFSSVNTSGESIEMGEYINKLKIAEKHDSLVHGFGMTRTSMLPRLPFYTVDSTTWLAGLKYGEISVWNGTKMSRIKKTEFESKAFPVIESYPMEFDLDAIKSEEVTEMIKVNVYAFVLSEEYIRDKLKSMMYWLKAKSVKQDVDNLSADFFPSPEWLENPNLDEVRGYAEQMNINQEHETVTDLVIQATLFMNWYNPNYTNIRDLHFDNEEIINNFHDFYVNKIRSTTEEKIADLIEFYKECIAGESDTLLHLGTNFDRVVREREEYIEEEEYDLEDVDEEEIRGRLANLLPTPEDGDPAPEISSLDDEIFSNVDIVPIRDERGRLVKGQKKVKRPKQVYSKKFPKLACDTCHASAKCPEYKAGYVCAFHRMFNRFSTRDMGDIIESMQGIVEHNMTRMQKAMIMETMNGTIDPVVSQLMDTNLKYMQMLQQMYEHGSPEVLKKTTTIRADGTREEVTSYTNPQGGGILEKLFAQPNNAKEEEDKSINDLVDDEPKKEEKRDTTKEINADYIEVTIDKD